MPSKVSEFLGRNSRYAARGKRPPPFGRILDVLRRYDLLPAIFFLKSRSDCDRALEACRDNRPSDLDRRHRRKTALEEVGRQNPRVAQHRQIWHLAERAVGAHHAGQLPSWKMVLERLMTEGLLDAVFATTTVAAGVNFPARTIAILNSDRFNGTQFQQLDATEFHQMTGRAGRRGLDQIGFVLAIPGRFMDNKDENVVYWYHGIDVDGRRETKVFASEFGDDYDAILAYEQIYALAGPIQTYRVTGDPDILRDAELTVDLFVRFFLVKGKGGYFSHLDPLMLDPRSESLGANKGKKNWNSVGDHAPAYLINLYLATGEERYFKMLEYTFDTITNHFQDYENSPFVQEKFFEDWSHDRTHMWQQNRGVVGHNLKIAWNLMRMFGLKPKPEYEVLARKIAEMMPAVGGDQQRGGWYDGPTMAAQPPGTARAISQIPHQRVTSPK